MSEDAGKEKDTPIECDDINNDDYNRIVKDDTTKISQEVVNRIETRTEFNNKNLDEVLDEKATSAQNNEANLKVKATKTEQQENEIHKISNENPMTDETSNRTNNEKEVIEDENPKGIEPTFIEQQDTSKFGEVGRTASIVSEKHNLEKEVIDDTEPASENVELKKMDSSTLPTRTENDGEEHTTEIELTVKPDYKQNLANLFNSSIAETATSTVQKVATEEETLKQETFKVEDAINNLNAPPLPTRGHIASSNPTSKDSSPVQTPANVTETSPTASQSPVSPPLPPRNHNKRQQHAVPPPLKEELQSDRFKKNLALCSDHPPLPPRTKGENQNKRLNSVAEINLIANRLRQTSHHYQEEDKASRENLDKGKDILKVSYSTFLESLPPTPSLNKEEKEKDHQKNEAESVSPQNAIDWEFWTRVVEDFPSVATESEILEEKVTDGIPAPIRGIIWQLVANSKSKEFEDIYETLSDTQSPHEASIRRDLKRTKHLPEDKADSLFKILSVYSIYDPDVGYTQGMAFIVTPLILNCKTPAEALGLLISLMKSYGLRDLFLPDMPGLMMLLYQFDRLLEENSPQLYNHLTRQGVRSTMYATQWFLTFFAYKFPLGFVLRIFDIVFVEGIESILRFAVNLMLKNSATLLSLNFDKLLDFLKNELFNYYLMDSVEARQHKGEVIDSDDSDTGSVLKKSVTSSSHSMVKNTVRATDINDDDYDIELFVHEAMHDVHITPISLKRYSAEYDEIHQIEQQKEAQYESIKIKNQQLQKEVRKLEHDYTLLNREHIQIANELIQNRLKIETLLDESNEQKLIILELKKQLDEEIHKQTMDNPDASLPSDLRVDLDRTIKRNAEVMDENAKLQDKINEQDRIIIELRQGIESGIHIATSPSKPPLKNGWSGFKKVFK